MIDEAYLKSDFVQLVERSGSNIKQDLPKNLLAFFVNHYKDLTVSDANSDYLKYVSGRRLWSDDPEDGEVEVIVLDCERVIEGGNGVSGQMVMSLSFDFDVMAYPELGNEPFQSDWCVDKKQADSFLDHISTDLTFQVLKDKMPLRVHLLSYRVDY